MAKLFRLAGFALFFSLAGCAVEPASQAMLDAYRLVRQSETEQAAGGLNPDFRYLRVQVGERELFMALGYVDPTPDGQVEVWYSADHNVLRLRNGRLVGVTMKSGVDWLNVSFTHLPEWDKLEEQATFERSRDVSPGYRYGIHEKMVIRRIAPPADSQLKVILASSLTWFEEAVQDRKEVHPSRYAVSPGATHQVVYAEQCLSDEFCLSWQNWPYHSKGMH